MINVYLRGTEGTGVYLRGTEGTGVVVIVGVVVDGTAAVVFVAMLI